MSKRSVRMVLSLVSCGFTVTAASSSWAQGLTGHCIPTYQDNYCNSPEPVYTRHRPVRPNGRSPVEIRREQLDQTATDDDNAAAKYFNADQYAEAIAKYQNALDACGQAGNCRSEFISHAQHYLALAKADQDWLAGNDFFHRGDFETAVLAYRKALQETPSDNPDISNLQKDLDRAQKRSDAHDVVQGMQQRLYEAYQANEAGLALFKKRDYKAAAKNFRVAIHKATVYHPTQVFIGRDGQPLTNVPDEKEIALASKQIPVYRRNLDLAMKKQAQAEHRLAAQVKVHHAKKIALRDIESILDAKEAASEPPLPLVNVAPQEPNIRKVKADWPIMELAAKAYSTKVMPGKSPFVSNHNWKMLEIADARALPKKRAALKAAGFDAYTYINKHRKTIVVAIQGSRPINIDSASQAGTRADIVQDWWVNDIKKALLSGRTPPQFEIARQYVASIKAAYGGKYTIVCAGHSLGGGACAYAAGMDGVRAVVINPISSSAPVLPQNEHLIDNYVVDGEMASTAYGLAGRPIIGHRYRIKGYHRKNRNFMGKAEDAVASHGVNTALNDLARQLGLERIK